MATPTEVLKVPILSGRIARVRLKPFPGSGKGVLYSDGKGRWVFVTGQPRITTCMNGRMAGLGNNRPQRNPLFPKSRMPLRGGISSVADFLKILVSPGLWVRIGEGVLGLILIAIGFSKLTGIEPPIVKALT